LRGWLEYIKRARPHQLPAAYAKLNQLNDDFSTRPVLPFDDRAALEYERLLRTKTRVGAMDLRIAAICIANDQTLVTRNVHHFIRINGLDVQDWTRSIV